MFLQIYASEIWVRNISMLLTFVCKLSGISVNKGTNLRLEWTEYSDFMKLSTRASTLFIFIVCFLTREQNAGKVYCRSHVKNCKYSDLYHGVHMHFVQAVQSLWHFIIYFLLLQMNCIWALFSANALMPKSRKYTFLL